MFLPITQSAMMAKYNPALRDGTFAAWKKVDLKVISKCDEVWVVKMIGWKESVGVTAEIKFARKKGIKVKFIDPVSLKFVKGD